MIRNAVLAQTEASLRTSAPSLAEQTPLYLIGLFILGAAVFVTGVVWWWRVGGVPTRSYGNIFVAALGLAGLVGAGSAAWVNYIETLRGPQTVTLSSIVAVETSSTVDPAPIAGGDTGIPEFFVEHLAMVDYERTVTLDHSRMGEPPEDTRTITWVGQPADGLTQDQAMDIAVEQLKAKVETLAQRDVTVERNLDRGAIVIKPANEPDGNPYWFTASLVPLDDGNIRVGTYMTVAGWGTGFASVTELVPPTSSEEYAIVQPLSEVDGMALVAWSSSATAGPAVEIAFEFSDDLLDSYTLDLGPDRDSSGSNVVCTELDDALKALIHRLTEYDPTVVVDRQEGRIYGSDFVGFEGDAVRGAYSYRCMTDGTVARASVPIRVTFTSGR